MRLELGNINYRVRQMQPMIDFYRDVLELPVSDDQDQGEYHVGDDWLILQTGEQTALELLDQDVHTVPKDGGSPAGNRLWPILWTEDLEESRATLQGRGVSFTSDVFEETWGWFCFFQDPDGNDIELAQWRDAEEREQILADYEAWAAARAGGSSA